jgi:hypothetical protein
VTSPFRAALDLIPLGYSEGLYRGRRYGMQKTLHAGGKGLKFFARELGGTDFVSLNLYQLALGDLLKPCEMPEAKVRDFILSVTILA